MGKYGNKENRMGQSYQIKGRNYKSEQVKPLATPNQRGLYQSGSIEDRLPGTEYSGRELGELASQEDYSALAAFALVDQMDQPTDDVERKRFLALMYGLAAFGVYLKARNKGIDEKHPLYQQFVQPALDYAAQKISSYSPKGESANYAQQKGYSPKGDDTVGYAGLTRQKYLD